MVGEPSQARNPDAHSSSFSLSYHTRNERDLTNSPASSGRASYARGRSAAAVRSPHSEATMHNCLAADNPVTMAFQLNAPASRGERSLQNEGVST